MLRRSGKNQVVSCEATHYPSALSVDLSRKSNWSSLVADGRDYLIEYLGTVSYSRRAPDTGVNKSVGFNDASSLSRPFAFRMTARGYGEDDNIYTVLQSVYTTEQGTNPNVLSE